MGGFRTYCQQCTDSQLREVIRREYEAGKFDVDESEVSRGVLERRNDYEIAAAVGTGRGWNVHKGEVL